MDVPATVFLVDDDAEMRESLRWLLRMNGYDVVSSATASEALASYDPLRPGCLVLDIQLPESTGIELYEKLLERGGAHPFIVITAYGRIPLAVKAIQLGAVDFIEKPFDNEQLLTRIAEAVEKDAERRRQADERKRLIARLSVLARREWQVALLVAEGKTSKQIARALHINVRTVEGHRMRLNKKLQTESTAEIIELMAKARSLQSLGVLDLPN